MANHAEGWNLGLDCEVDTITEPEGGTYGRWWTHPSDSGNDHVKLSADFSLPEHGGPPVESLTSDRVLDHGIAHICGDRIHVRGRDVEQTAPTTVITALSNHYRGIFAVSGSVPPPPEYDRSVRQEFDFS